MATQTQPNGRVRRSLADQIDRLDSVIDALSDGLNEAVATVVEQAVQKAVQTVLTEVLTNPELRQMLAATGNPAQPIPPPSTVPVAPQPVAQTRGQCLLGTVQKAWDQVAEKARQAAALVGELAGRCGRTVRVWAGNAGTLAVLLLWWLNQYRSQVLVASCIGIGIGATCYLAGPLIASTVSGFAATLIAAVLGALRRGWADLTAPERPRRGCPAEDVMMWNATVQPGRSTP